MLEVGEVLATPALEDLIRARLVNGTKSGQRLIDRLWLQGAESRAGVARGAEGNHNGAARCSPGQEEAHQELDAHTTGGAEVKSKLVATEVACGNRDDCFAGTPSAEG